LVDKNKIRNKTTKEFRIPTTKTRRNQRPVPDSTRLLFCAHPLGDAKATGTPITRRKDSVIKAKTES